MQQFSLSQKKFVQALVDNMENRFPNDEMMMAATVLDPSTWPTDDDHKVLYGDCEVATLAKTAGMPVCAQKFFCVHQSSSEYCFWHQ